MLRVTQQNVKEWAENETFRTMFTRTVTDIAGEVPEAVLMVADLGRAMKAAAFISLYPERYIQVGIAEQNLIGVAAGLASCGKIPFVTTFAPFATMRCCEQIRDDVAYTNFNVKIVGSESGVSLGTLGATHYAIEDIGVMRSIPNMVIISPADGAELVKSMQAAARYYGPVYIRMGGSNKLPFVYKDDYEFVLGKAVMLKEGTDCTIIATGTMVSRALDAAVLLEKEGINARVINMHTIKPIDEDAIIKAANDTGLVVTVEEHNIVGGLGSAVGEVMAQNGTGKLVKFGLPDMFASTIAPYNDLLERYGLTSENIALKIRELVKR